MFWIYITISQQTAINFDWHWQTFNYIFWKTHFTFYFKVEGNLFLPYLLPGKNDLPWPSLAGSSAEHILYFSPVVI